MSFWVVALHNLLDLPEGWGLDRCVASASSKAAFLIAKKQCVR